MHAPKRSRPKPVATPASGPCPPVPRGPGRPRVGIRTTRSDRPARDARGALVIRARRAVLALCLVLSGTAAAASPDFRDTARDAAGDLPATHGALVARGDPLTCLATAIYHEARGETRAGQRAVASVILQRVATPGRWGDSVCDVIAPSQFTFYTGPRCRHGAGPGPCLVPPVHDRQAWSRAVDVARRMMAAGPLAALEGADHYHADHIHPGWARAMTPLGRVGRHLFYADPESRRARAAMSGRATVSTKSPPAMFLREASPARIAASPVMCLPRQGLAARHTPTPNARRP